jgi:hypothetical protein
MPNGDQDSSVEKTSVALNPAEVDYSRAQMVRFYTNHVGAQVSFFDIRLLLSTVRIEDKRLVSDETVTVLMTPELAIVLRQILDKALQSYTTSYGAIREANTSEE